MLNRDQLMMLISASVYLGVADVEQQKSESFVEKSRHLKDPFDSKETINSSHLLQTLLCMITQFKDEERNIL